MSKMYKSRNNSISISIRNEVQKAEETAKGMGSGCLEGALRNEDEEEKCFSL